MTYTALQLRWTPRRQSKGVSISTATAALTKPTAFEGKRAGRGGQFRCTNAQELSLRFHEIDVFSSCYGQLSPSTTVWSFRASRSSVSTRGDDVFASSVYLFNRSAKSSRSPQSHSTGALVVERSMTVLAHI